MQRRRRRHTVSDKMKHPSHRDGGTWETQWHVSYSVRLTHAVLSRHTNADITQCCLLCTQRKKHTYCNRFRTMAFSSRLMTAGFLPILHKIGHSWPTWWLNTFSTYSFENDLLYRPISMLLLFGTCLLYFVGVCFLVIKGALENGPESGNPRELKCNKSARKLEEEEKVLVGICLRAFTVAFSVWPVRL